MYTTLKGGVIVTVKFSKNITEEDLNDENIKIIYDTRSD